MRVAVVYDCLFPINSGGGERVYRRLAESLAHRGHDVDYFTRAQWKRSAPPEAPFVPIGIWRGQIYDENGTRTLASAVGFAAAVFRSMLKRRSSYDLVVVSALPVLNVLAAQLALLGSNTVIVADWLEVWTWRKWREYSGAIAGTIAFALQWLGLRSAHIHTVNSSFTAARVRHYSRRARPITLGLLDLIEADVVPKFAAANPPFALFVGRHIPDKQVSAIPVAVATVRRSIPDFRAVIVGEGPETAAVARLVHEQGLQDAIELPGKVSQERLDSLFQDASVLVNPSRREGFGLVVAEAARVGTPSVVVASPDNASVDLIDPGVNGFVAPSAEADVLASAIIEVVQKGVALRSTTAAWFDEARRSSNLDTSIDSILHAYRAKRNA